MGVRFMYSDIDYDYEYTKKHGYEMDYRCDCDNCTYYYGKFGGKYPKVKELLEKFGLNIEYALEIMDLGKNEADFREYMAYYVVKGSLKDKRINFKLDELSISFIDFKEEDVFWPTPDIDEPYFIIEICGIIL